MPSDVESLRQRLVIPFVAAVVLLLAAAFGRWPYGFYQLLRLIVCGASVYGALLLADSSKVRMWTLIAVAILFNPIAPIYFIRNDWAQLDLLVAVTLTVVLLTTRRA